MGKDENKIESWFDDAFKLTTSSDEVSEEEMRRLMSEEEGMQIGRENLACKRALLEEYAEHKQPDIDLEWNKFQQKRTEKTRRKRYLLGSVIGGVAACFLLIFGLNILPSGKQGELFFAADSLVHQVTLQKVGGSLLALDAQTQDSLLSMMGVTLTQSDSLQLSYRSKTVEEKIETHILSTPRGQDFSVVLSDGTVVWLNAESRLEYPSRFTGEERIVRLQGEAYFKVAKDSRHPFIVQTSQMHTRVLGTEFNIRSYSSDDSHVTLVEGSVEIRSQANQTYLRMKPGEDAHLLDDGTFSLHETDVDTYVYWKEGFFYFDDAPLTTILQELGRWYNVNIVFNNPSAKNWRIHYVCDRKDSIERAVLLLSRINKLNVSFDNNTIYIK